MFVSMCVNSACVGMRLRGLRSFLDYTSLVADHLHLHLRSTAPLLRGLAYVLAAQNIHEPVIQYASVHADQPRTPEAPIIHIAVEAALEADETGVIEVVRPLSGPCDSNLDVIDCEVSLGVGIFRRPDLCCCLHLKVTHLHLRVRVH